MVVGNVMGLPPGIYHYSPAAHTLDLRVDGDKRADLASAALDRIVRQAPMIIAFAAVVERTAARYGSERGLRYVHMEVGHAGEERQLQGVSLGLGSVVVGAFQRPRGKSVLGLPGTEQPMYLIPVGHVPGVPANGQESRPIPGNDRRVATAALRTPSGPYRYWTSRIARDKSSGPTRFSVRLPSRSSVSTDRRGHYQAGD